jgi:hypothetical protein
MENVVVMDVKIAHMIQNILKEIQNLKNRLGSPSLFSYINHTWK